MWERRIRLYSGLLVTVYVIPHLTNHALGLISLEAAEGMRKVMHVIWAGPPLGPILLLAFLLHFLLSLHALFKRSTLRMPPWEAIQIGLGTAIFPLILTHVAGTAIAGEILDFEPTYKYVVAALWITNPEKGLQQAIVLLAVWGHLCVGLHFWLRLSAWYQRGAPYFYAVAILMPVLSLLGFARMGQELTLRAIKDELFLSRIFEPITAGDPAMIAGISSIEPNGWIIFAILIIGVFIGRIVRRVYRNRRGVYRLTLPGGRALTTPVGTTILDSLRDAGIPHASVCGGRGRCTTCRVHVGNANEHLPKPEEAEARALARVNAEPEVRLACQCRPRHNLSIVPMLEPTATAQDTNRPGGIQGREQEVATIFIDLRGSTKLGEARLPYDVLFILNQFFAEMAAALANTHGHYAQFTGDGLMALYGLERGVEQGCRDAIRGAQEMIDRLNKLNAKLERELKDPLEMGIGIHCGEAIVGTMGPPTAQNFSAIGDNINITARLESLTKNFGCQLVLSEAAAKRAGVSMKQHTLHSTDVRGRDEALDVYAIDDPRQLADLDLP